MNKSNSKHIKDLANQQTSRDSVSDDSNTNVIMVWKGPKSVHSFRCSDKLWKAFVHETKAQGDSVCHVMEAIIAAVLGVLKQDVYNRNTIKIEKLQVQRVVERHRRKTHEYAPEANMYDPKLFDWVYVEDAFLNENGHAVGCMCSECAPHKRGRKLVTIKRARA